MDWKCCILLFMWKLSFSLSSPRCCMLTIKILILGHMPHQTNYLCKFAFNIWFPTDGRMQNYKAKIWKMLLIKAALNFNKKASNKLQFVFDGDVVKNSHHFSFIRIFDKKIAYILQAQKKSPYWIRNFHLCFFWCVFCAYCLSTWIEMTPQITI